MFASLRRFIMTPNVLPVDDLESLFYLICFFFMGFSLPWLNDYCAQRSVREYFKLRKQKHAQYMQELLADLPQELKLLYKYIDGLNSKLACKDQKDS